MKRAALLLVQLIIVSSFVACRLPEPLVPEAIQDGEIIRREDDTVYIDTWDGAVVNWFWLDNDMIRELAALGPDLTYGHFSYIDPHQWDDDEDDSGNVRKFKYRENGLTFEVVISWSEEIKQPGNDTPLVSAVVTLASDPTVTGDLLSGDILAILQAKMK